jgi:hypothetical protein
MTRRFFLVAPALLVLGACQQPSDAPEPPPIATVGNYVARVEALGERQRFGVLFRAVRDAGQDCQELTDATSTTTTDRRPAWIVTCDARTRWTVVLSNDGTALVTPVSQAR